jgi:site-specific recombinase XerD
MGFDRNQNLIPVNPSDGALPPALLAHILGADDVRFTLKQFFEAEVENTNTRRAYRRGAADFFVYLSNCPPVDTLAAISSLHVSGWLGDMAARRLSVPTIKLRLAGLRRMFDALARAQIIRFNPVAVVKGPRYSIDKGKTPVLTGGETLQLLAAIDTSTLIGLRDRAMIATMAYTFARIGAVIGLEAQHLFRQQRRLWLRLSEKGGQCRDVPCHHQLEEYLAEWIEAAALGDAPAAPLFQMFTWEQKPDQAAVDLSTPAHADTQVRKRILSGNTMTQSLTWKMLRRRAKLAGIDTKICNHTFRATGITSYLSNGGTIERAAHIAGHRSTRTTQLYDRRSDAITLDEIEKIRFA